MKLILSRWMKQLSAKEQKVFFCSFSLNVIGIDISLKKGHGGEIMEITVDSSWVKNALRKRIAMCRDNDI